MGKIVKKKILTAVLIIPPVIMVITLGSPAAFSFIVLLTAFFGLREFFHLALPRSNRTERWAGIGLGLILSLFLSFGDPKMIPPFIVVLLLVPSILFMATSRNLSASISHIGIMFFGIFYIGYLLPHVSLIRSMTDGKYWVLFLVITVWAGDIFALLSGSLFGRHKLYPKVSPNKTYEGLIGAILGSIIVSFAFSVLSPLRLGRGLYILIAIGLAFLGQMGDFIESMLKRSAQVKDSGSLIPGHGGMLDRLDSFLFSAPFLHYLLLYLLKENP